MNILLTGATGNLGRHTLELLLARGHHVRCIVRPSKKNQQKMAAYADSPYLEIIWGDFTSSDVVESAIKGCGYVVHVAFVIPPQAIDFPEMAEKSNIGGMKTLLSASLAQEKLPRFLFVSSCTVAQGEFITVDTPTIASTMYTKQKLECEHMLKGSPIQWSIFRFCDIIPISSQRGATKYMYEIPLDKHMEILHPDDGALALANGLERDIWGRTFLIGGGKRCQLLYRDYLRYALSAFRIESLPKHAFNAQGLWGTGWLDTADSEALLEYQKHSATDIFHEANGHIPTPLKFFLPIFSPIIKNYLLSFSPYYKRATL